MSKKQEKQKPMIDSRHVAELNGYTFKEIVLKYATSWWVFGPASQNLGFVVSEQLAIERCEMHWRRAHGEKT